MILEFSARNCRSIREKVTLSLVADKTVNRKNELPENLFEIEEGLFLHKTVVLYVRNASGKSNLLLALKQFVDFISDSDKNKVGEEISQYELFFCDSNTKTTPVEFEISFLLRNSENQFIKYYYQVSFNQVSVLSESLYFYPKGQKAKLTVGSHSKFIILFNDLYK